jgi:hypothetical protein
MFTLNLTNYDLHAKNGHTKFTRAEIETAYAELVAAELELGEATAANQLVHSLYYGMPYVFQGVLVPQWFAKWQSRQPKVEPVQSRNQRDVFPVTNWLKVAQQMKRAAEYERKLTAIAEQYKGQIEQDLAKLNGVAA